MKRVFGKHAGWFISGILMALFIVMMPSNVNAEETIINAFKNEPVIRY